MMWYPEKAAFRAGFGNGSWDDGNIGNYSVAFGYGTNASGLYSFSAGNSNHAAGEGAVALGVSNDALGEFSLAAGGYSYASGEYSVALGLGWAIGDYATSVGRSGADGDYAFAAGDTAYAEEHFSAAFGYYTWASAQMSVAFGDSTYTDGVAAAAFGTASSALGDYSFATGRVTRVTPYASMVVGHYNEDRHDDTDSTTINVARTAWQGDDQHSVLEVGIGPDNTNRKNALTVLQDGSVEVGKATATDNSVPLHIKADGSVVLAKAQGDIPMFGQ